jgi:hypothetical protein
MLKAVLSQLLPDSITVQYIVFQGKQDLEKNIQRKLRGWMQPDTYFLIMRDQDSGDCLQIKQSLSAKAAASGKADKAIIRIACHELESFYLGDLLAVERGLNIPRLSSHQGNKKFRAPDRLSNPAQELERLTDKQYQKIQGTRSIAPFLRLDGSNRSHSFNVLLAGIRSMAERIETPAP